jgi:hypothetical protein
MSAPINTWATTGAALALALARLARHEGVPSARRWSG